MKAETVILIAEGDLTSGDAMEVHCSLRLLDRAADSAYCHSIISQCGPVLETGTCGVGQVLRLGSNTLKDT